MNCFQPRRPYQQALRMHDGLRCDITRELVMHARLRLERAQVWVEALLRADAVAATNGERQNLSRSVA